MITLLFLWFIIATVVEDRLALVPSDIPKLWKRTIYYVVTAPCLALGVLKHLAGFLSFQWQAAVEWLKE